jgi:hypothetical protein
MVKVKDGDELKILEVSDNGVIYFNRRTRKKATFITSNGRPNVRKGNVLIVDIWTDGIRLIQKTTGKILIRTHNQPYN